ncbi:hypothetical protein FOL47_001840 [Perkinsus chesapeaki]|uniref:Thioredoxin domain-containing protein n=1 Tax=Perkinsus chesapeaki TaxID=330153 RepID=A0A7J6MHZ5_PERCH|nr:hypothetical protein FOL47_001840 [Perkinsus chesapeaki]
MFGALSARMAAPMAARLASPAMARFAAPLAFRSFGTLIGKQAPSFEAKACMPDNTFKTINTSDYKGKYVVLYFYPGDFTFVCATETIEFHNKLEEFKKRGAEVLGCSVDSADVHKAWKNTAKTAGGLGTQINHPMISDNKHEISKAYQVLLDEPGVACRGVFIIDKEGKVRSELKNDLPLGRNVDEVLRILDALEFTDSHGDQVCPVAWHRGQEAMKASTEGVAEYLTKHT